ncbi:hypothetical protein HK096_003451, partial [Nowakowskiella sp. JEL0078]
KQSDGNDDDDDDEEDDDDGEICSDLDDEESEDEEREADHLILCQYEKVSRIKNRWRCVLKDGIINVNGKDYLLIVILSGKCTTSECDRGNLKCGWGPKTPSKIRGKPVELEAGGSVPRSLCCGKSKFFDLVVNRVITMENLDTHSSLGVLAEVAGAVSLEIATEDKSAYSPATFSENVQSFIRSYSSSRSPVSSHFAPSHSSTFNLNSPRTFAKAVPCEPTISPANSYIPVVNPAGSHSMPEEVDFFSNLANTFGSSAVTESHENSFKQKSYQVPNPNVNSPNLNAVRTDDICLSPNHSTLQSKDESVNLLWILESRYDVCSKELHDFETKERRLHIESEEIRVSLLKLQDQLDAIEKKKIEIRKCVKFHSEELKSQTQKINEISSQILIHKEIENRAIEKSDLESVMILNPVQQSSNQIVSPARCENKRGLSTSNDTSDQKNKRSREKNGFTYEKIVFPSSANSNENDEVGSETIAGISRRISNVCRDFNLHGCRRNCMKEHICINCYGKHSLENCKIDIRVCLRFNIDENSCHENVCGHDHRCLRCASTNHGLLLCTISPPKLPDPNGENCSVWNSQLMKSNDSNSLSSSADSRNSHYCLRTSESQAITTYPTKNEMLMSFRPKPTFQVVDQHEQRIPAITESGEYVDTREFEVSNTYNKRNDDFHEKFINALNGNRMKGIRLPPVFGNKNDDQISEEQPLMQYPSVSSLGPRGNSEEILRDGNILFSPTMFNKNPVSRSSNFQNINHQTNIVKNNSFKNTSVQQPQYISSQQLHGMSSQQFTTMQSSRESPNQTRQLQLPHNVNQNRQSFKSSSRAKTDYTTQSNAAEDETKTSSPALRMSHAKAMAVALAAGLPKPRFLCQFCNRNFSRSDSLKRHIRIKLCNGDNPTPPRKNPKKLAEL